MSGAFYLLGQRVPVNDPKLKITDYVEDGEVRFSSRPWPGRVRHIVLHESVTRSKKDTVRVLKSQGYGVHIIVDADGSISQHGDLRLDQMAHAGFLNGSSVGVEVVNPYNPTFCYRIATLNRWKDTTPAEWWTWVPKGAPRVYTLPTPEQRATLVVLVPLLAALLPDVDLAFPTASLHGKFPGWDAPKGKPKPTIPSGILAHCDFSEHADGRFPLEYIHSHFKVS